MSLSLNNIELRLPKKVLLQRFSLEIAQGEIVTLMGPSGSGKSSLLAAISGDIAAPFHFEGEVTLNGKALTTVAPYRRGIGRLFQDDLLFPHMTVGENLLFGSRQGSRETRLTEMRQALKRVELENFENRNPATLSGGERQRASLMRMVLSRPNAVLLDEPFSKLDRSLRKTIRQTAFEILREQNLPTLLVSHDQEDAPAGGRILQILNDGQLANV